MDGGAVGEFEAQVVGVAVYLYAWSVFFVMVVAAPEDEVVEIGWSVCGVGCEVVDFAPGGWDVAAWPAAAAVAGDEGFVLVVAGVAHRATEIEMRTGSDDSLQVGVLGESTDNGQVSDRRWR